MARMTPRRKAQLILELAMKINNTPTKQELTGDKPTIFVWFSGHCNLLNVEIHSNGWCEGNNPDYRYYLYLSDNVDKFNECITVLKNIWQQYKHAYTKEPAQIEEVSVNAV